MPRISLLLVEDDPDVRDVIGLALRLDPLIEVESYESAEAAREAILIDKQPFDIALLDFQLPLMNGINLHLHLRKPAGMPNLVTVLTTAGLSDADMGAFEKADIAGLIPKPFDPLTLAKEVCALSQFEPPIRLRNQVAGPLDSPTLLRNAGRAPALLHLRVEPRPG